MRPLLRPIMAHCASMCVGSIKRGVGLPLFLLLVLLIAPLRSGAAASDPDVADVHYPHVLLERLAFGSCNKQKRRAEQEAVWAGVAAFEPQVWLWTGDAVYAENHSVPALEEALRAQLQVPGYATALAGGGGGSGGNGLERRAQPVLVDGVWDDHDLGINDGGKEVPHLAARQDAYLDFLDQSRSLAASVSRVLSSAKPASNSSSAAAASSSSSSSSSSGEAEGEDEDEDAVLEAQDREREREREQQRRDAARRGRRGLYRSLTFGVPPRKKLVSLL